MLVIDMEGKADGRALKTLLPHMNPKKLVSMLPYLECLPLLTSWDVGTDRRGR